MGFNSEFKELKLLKINLFQSQLFNCDNMPMQQSIAGYFSGPIVMFVFHILRIPTGCVQICSGSTALTCSPWLWDWDKIQPN